MKTKFLLALFISVVTLNAQNLEGELTINGKSNTEINLETNSAVQLFKAFKTGKYQLQFNFDANDIPKNIYGETIVLFEFKTEIYKDGKLVKNLSRKQPIPYFPGEMQLPAEAFDFAGLLVFQSWDDMKRKEGSFGVMPKGKYSVKLYATPKGFSGEIRPVEFEFNILKNQITK